MSRNAFLFRSPGRLPGDFFFFLRQTVRAHAVGGFGGEFGIEIIFHRHPFAVVLHLAAPTANAQIFFEMMQSLEQPPHEHVHPQPNQSDDDGAEKGAVPIRLERFAKKMMRDAQPFGEP